MHHQKLRKQCFAIAKDLHILSNICTKMYGVSFFVQIDIILIKNREKLFFVKAIFVSMQLTHLFPNMMISELYILLYLIHSCRSDKSLEYHFIDIRFLKTTQNDNTVCHKCFILHLDTHFLKSEVLFSFSCQNIMHNYSYKIA